MTKQEINKVLLGKSLNKQAFIGRLLGGGAFGALAGTGVAALISFIRNLQRIREQGAGVGEWVSRGKDYIGGLPEGLSAAGRRARWGTTSRLLRQALDETLADKDFKSQLGRGALIGGGIGTAAGGIGSLFEGV